METEAGDWQTGKEEVRDRLTHLLQSNTWADCSFAVGSEAEIVKAHKFVLSMASPVFETMFYGRWTEGNTPIPVPDIEPETFKKLLNYMYTDQVPLTTCTTACDLYYAAQKYMLPRVRKTCITYIEKNLKACDVCYAYEMATVFDEENLRKMCLKKIVTQTKEILKDPSITEASLPTLKEIVSQDYLAIDNELDLFNAVYKWVKARGHRGLKRSRTSEGVACKRAKIENDSTQTSINLDTGLSQSIQESAEDTICIENRSIDLADLREILSKIRFLSMSLEQLTTVAKSALLPTTDALALLMIICGGKAEVPPGFSTSMEPRTPQQLVSASAGVSAVDVEYQVLNFKSRKRAVGPHKVYCHGYEWIFRILPGSTTDPQRPMGIDLQCCGSTSSGWQCKVAFTIHVASTHNRGKKETYHWSFNEKNTRCYVERFMLWDEICSSTSGWLSCNSLKLELRISA